MDDNAIEMATLHLENATTSTIYGRTTTALSVLDTAEEILKDLADSVQVLDLRALCYEGKAKHYKSAGRMNEAKQFYRKAVDIWSVNELEDKTKRDNANLLAAQALIELGDIEKAAVFADKVLDAYEYEEGLEVGILFLGVARVYAKNLGKYYNKAKKALVLARANYIPDLSLVTASSLFEIQRLLADIAHKYEKDDKNALQELERSWEFAEIVGVERCDQNLIVSIPGEALAYCKNMEGEDYVKWTFRTIELFGRYIGTGKFNDYTGVKFYLKINITWYFGFSVLDKSVDVERALKCVETMQRLTHDPVDIAQAQWLAGCALITLGKEKDARRAIRLMKRAVQVLRATTDSMNLAASAIGEGFIADDYFSKEEYEEAESWYRTAMKDLGASDISTDNVHGDRFSAGIEECAKRIKGYQ
ncbi:MAG: tetratricopeptide repeat protein [Clostridiales bacterium]|nr:tetratricopeptide repeat protein [Clostridiales bacterium]